MAALAQFAQMDLLQAATEWEALGYSDESDLWHDSILVCRKPNLGAWWMAKSSLKRWLQHYTATIGMA
jgi:hypothetical protein